MEQEKLREIAKDLKNRGRGDELFFQTTPVEAITVYLRDGDCCQYCKKAGLFRDVETLKAGQNMDHLLPQSLYKDLEKDEWNLVPACSYCNQLKWNWDANDEKLSGKPPAYPGQGPLTKQQHDELLQRAQEHVESKRRRQQQLFPNTRALWESALAKVGRQ